MTDLMQSLLTFAQAMPDRLPANFSKKKVTGFVRIDGVDASYEEHKLVMPLPTVSRGSNIRANSYYDTFQYALGCGAPGMGVKAAEARYVAYQVRLSALAETMPEAEALEDWLTDPARPLLLPLGKGATQEVVDRLFEIEPKVSKLKKVKTSTGVMKRGEVVADEVILGAWACVLHNAIHNHPGFRRGETEIIVLPETPKSYFIPLIGDQGVESLTTPSADLVNAHKAYIQSKKMKKNTAEKAQCGLCGAVSLPVRLHKDAGGKMKVMSFNAPAWNAYGKTQGYNAPTCETCAEDIAAALYRLRASGSLAKRTYGTDREAIWFHYEGGTPLPLISRILDGEITATDWSFTDGVFVETKLNSKRLVIMGFYPYNGEALARRLHRWRALGLQDPFRAAFLLGHRGHAHRPSDDPLFTEANLRLHRWLATGDPNHLRGARPPLSLLSYESDDMPEIEYDAPEDMNDLQAAAWYAGEVFARACVNQRSGGRSPQVDLATKTYRRARGNLTHAIQTAQRYDSYRKRKAGGGHASVHDKRMVEGIATYAVHAQRIADQEGFARLARLRPHESLWFDRGFAALNARRARMFETAKNENNESAAAK